MIEVPSKNFLNDFLKNTKGLKVNKLKKGLKESVKKELKKV